MGYQLIEHIEVGSGGAASIEFTGIPQDGVDLVCVVSARESGTDTQPYLEVIFNSLTTNYSGIQLRGDGSSVTSAGANRYITGGVNSGAATANTFASTKIYISNYAGSTAKSWSVDAVNENNATLAYQNILALLWNNTSAITSLKVGYPNMVEYSTASLYKITAD
jgi:hypothetical protein